MHSWGTHLHLPGKACGQLKGYCNTDWVGVLEKVTESLNDTTNGTGTELVSSLIEPTTRKWKVDLIEHTFPEKIAQKILQLPVAEEAHEDFQVWRGENSGEFTVRSVEDWLLIVPALGVKMRKKIASIYFDNVLQQQKHDSTLTSHGSQTLLFKTCGTGLPGFSTQETANNMIWNARNQFVHEGKPTTGKELAQKVQLYIAEIDGLEEKVLTSGDIKHPGTVLKEGGRNYLLRCSI
ncbi:reverse transcriptase [Gossypium australe]|uniref:Reverse transcriptase n=1 Tax=Gossypium australe TaxID=47621 RepID=A0A5B6X1M3_9ROSI|nr:reverse transcriptase [Gossypium australe]